MAPFNGLCRFLVSYPRFSKQLAFTVQKFQVLPVATVNLNVKITKAFCSTSTPKPQKEEVSVTFLRQSGERLSAKGKTGDSLLDIVVNNEVDIDGYGACEGTLACSTCHVLLTDEDYDRLPEPPTDEELDMLDLAYGLTPTSRLGCQIIMSKQLDGLTVKLPEGIADARGGN